MRAPQVLGTFDEIHRDVDLLASGPGEGEARDRARLSDGGLDGLAVHADGAALIRRRGDPDHCLARCLTLWIHHDRVRTGGGQARGIDPATAVEDAAEGEGGVVGADQPQGTAIVWKVRRIHRDDDFLAC